MAAANADREEAVEEYLGRSLGGDGATVVAMLLHLTGLGVEVTIGRRPDGVWSARVAYNANYTKNARQFVIAMEYVGRASAVDMVGSTLWVAVAKALATARGDTGWRSL